ncbi:hypothetical protein KC571_03685 [candidate division WWE3 bacterium]|uniref:Uncharacterized protein n=1 Tax=candidate division WWE3 bacterium TaxID=2053526 RepID=A0A955LHF6_UNCKA|nr:hypothetical protein [candidate division WWE3 bacterium]
MKQIDKDGIREAVDALKAQEADVVKVEENGVIYFICINNEAFAKIQDLYAELGGQACETDLYPTLAIIVGSDDSHVEEEFNLFEGVETDLADADWLAELAQLDKPQALPKATLPTWVAQLAPVGA